MAGAAGRKCLSILATSEGCGSTVLPTCIRPALGEQLAFLWAWSTHERSARSGTDACGAACPAEGLSVVPLAAATPG